MASLERGPGVPVSICTKLVALVLAEISLGRRTAEPRPHCGNLRKSHRVHRVVDAKFSCRQKEGATSSQWGLSQDPVVSNSHPGIEAERVLQTHLHASYPTACRPPQQFILLLFCKELTIYNSSFSRCERPTSPQQYMQTAFARKKTYSTTESYFWEAI